MIIRCADNDVELLPEKGLWMSDAKLLCVSDMHFEKGSFYASRSTFLPPYGTLETLEKLENLVRRLGPDIVVAAGDSFHDKRAVERMPIGLIERLNALVKTVPTWTWLTGNHDETISSVINGNKSVEMKQRGISFRHETLNKEEAEVSGHYHPKCRLRVKGHLISAPCFVVAQDRIFLPSFGQFTGGLDIDSPAFQAVAPKACRKVYIVHSDQIFAIG